MVVLEARERVRGEERGREVDARRRRGDWEEGERGLK
jgi:hypothetical protein